MGDDRQDEEETTIHEGHVYEYHEDIAASFEIFLKA